ncbi:transglycosylase domain-containing protein [Microbacterium sediminis]|uniref:PASTA domain-containing protein n=1 Tax=Microbacterium sediminis TaxID=904291 RepID=A0A1B9NBH3_9MICO|nr:transglycosylase domain-containing protein [Microbacterium sediminis]OCG73940.1 hypothetical protein A7J15_06965 [Microbacterium sediminis]QBR74693.1 PASTA domain-containing protein [Microbacterium sediminis]
MPNAKRTFSGVLSGLLGLVGLSAVAGVLVTAAVTPAIALSGTAAKSAIDLFENIPGYLEVDRPMLPTTLYAKDPQGNDWQMATFYDQNRIPVEYDEVSPVLYDAILSSEDPRYYEHGGIDLIGTTRALLNNATGGNTQGGSSISQQYVKNVLIQRCEQDSADQEELEECYLRYTTAQGTAGYERKLQEMRYAITIEQQYSKDDILLGYLNIANFGGQVYGIEAAARYYFGTTAKDLTVAQAATLAGVVQNPNTYRIDMKGGSWLNPQTGEYENSEADGYALTKARQTYVLTRMHTDGKITDEQYEAAKAEPIVPSIHPTDQGCVTAGQSAYFCQYVKTVMLTDEAFGATPEERRENLQRGGLKVYTTLDMRVQGAGEAAMNEWVPQSFPGMELGATGVTLEADTGRILAMVQNTKFGETAACDEDPACASIIYASDYAHGGSTGFQPGSAFKLFTLLDWLEEGKSVNQRLNGVNRDFSDFSCNGAPAGATASRDIGNYGRDPGRYDSIYNFTKYSLNSGFFAMAEQLDLCDINRVAERLGITYANGEPITKDNGPFATVLGGKEVAPMAMASAYSAVANGGVRCEPRAIDRVVDADGNELPVPESKCDQAIAPNVAATAAYTLQGVMTGGGSGSRANPGDGVPVLGKTGTHNDEQTFMVESSTQATTAVWVGNVQQVNGQWGSMASQWTDRGVALRDLRYYVASAMQGASNAAYGGDAFPAPDRNLLVTPMADLPNVTGMTVDEATRALEAAGFEARVGDPVAGDQPEGRIQTQDPGPGRIATGTVVTISPSNGKGTSVPSVNGLTLAAALGAVKSAGLDPALGTCTEADGAGSGRATGTSPASGELVSSGTRVTVNYQAANCGGGGGGGNGNGNGNGGDGDD